MEREGWSGHPYPLHSPPLSLDNVGRRAAPSLTVSDGALPTVSDGALPTASGSDDALPHHERKRRCPPPSLVAAAEAPPLSPLKIRRRPPNNGGGSDFPRADPATITASAVSHGGSDGDGGVSGFLPVNSVATTTLSTSRGWIRRGKPAIRWG